MMKKVDPRPPRVRAPDPRDAAAKQYALEKLKAICESEIDPFAVDAGHAFVCEKVKEIADRCEANAALVVTMANAGTEHAPEALAELISERNSAGEPLGPALTAYAQMISQNGPARVRLPKGRRRYNILEDRIIVYMVLDLMQQFPGLRLRRGPDTKRAAACSIVAEVLRDVGVWDWGGEQRVRKIWVRHGPPAIATYRRPPPPGVVRFTSDDI
jgi:hypothetical protein